MLKEISVRNLGCFDDSEHRIDFSDETLIAGPNSSGKSMMLAGMNFLRYLVVTGVSSWQNEFYSLVSYEEAVHDHNTDKSIRVAITITEGSNSYTYDLNILRNTLSLKVNDGAFARSVEDINRMKKILFFRPVRSPVRYSSLLQATSSPLQELLPDGSNVTNFLVEKFTAQHEGWEQAQSWLRKIDLDVSKMKTPIRGNQVAFETLSGNVPVNVSLQGSGFQSSATIVSAVIFAPEGSTIIIEEPEVFLHPSSQEIIVDMINDAVNNHKKQLIFSTHSMNILLPFYSDVGQDAARRTGEHIHADRNKFSMWTFSKIPGRISIENYPLHTKTFRQFREDFRYIWG